MKKTGAFLLSILLVLSISGCGQNKSQTQNSSKSGEYRKVVVGTSASYYPWAYQENDQLKGFEIDIWNEIAKRNQYDIEFKLSKFSGLVGMIDAGEIDTIAHQMSITPERLEKYDFSEPYAYSYYDFAVKNESQINKKEDLKGLKVGCWLGGNGEKTLRNVDEKYNLGLDIVTFDGAPIEKEVELGRIDACWQGEIKTLSTIKENSLDLKMLGEKLTFEINAYPFAKTEDGEKLAKEVSDTIKSMRQDKTLSKLSQKWFEMDTTDAPEGE